MSAVIQTILNWSEVWSLFIPLAVIIYKRKFSDYLKPVVIYFWIVLVLNIVIDVISEFKVALHFPRWLHTNNYIYNIKSIVELVCFSIFFIRINRDYLRKPKQIITILFLIFVLVNFIFFDDFFLFNSFSVRLLSVECSILLLYCLLYYLYFLFNDAILQVKDNAAFWITTGLSIYIVISFPIFIFYKILALQSIHFVLKVWQIQNVAFLLFCILTAIGFNYDKPNGSESI